MSDDRSGKLSDLVRILNLVQYWEQHPNLALSSAAADLGVDVAQLKADSKLLTTCGFGQYPDELFDLRVENRGVAVMNNLGLNRPLKLTTLEASSLLLTMQTLQGIPGFVQSEVVASVAEKLKRHLRGTEGAFDIASISQPVADPSLVLVSEALKSRRKIAFEYRNVRGEVRSFEASVASVVTAHGATYFKGYVDALAGHRMFRVDRMSEAHLLESAATPHMELSSARIDPDDVFGFSSAPEHAVCELAAKDAWVLEAITISEVQRRGDVLRVTIPVANRAWFEGFLVANADRVRLLEPDHLRQGVLHRAQRALNAYDDQP
ncbi:WYL domain-containing transcriptional regulator [Corynebacterium gerontici]|uniref:WYL domain-containing protein n=1 Tax=Corynebacterium gerontici TaxID=2079234 RepID=UPI0013DE007C|nr:WYL domain-containing protein [Corynebacterium gerontici]